MDEKKSTELVPVTTTQPELPPILVGRYTPAVEVQVRSFYGSVADIFERWVTRRQSLHTQRAYRQDVMDFVQFLDIRWPEEAPGSSRARSPRSWPSAIAWSPRPRPPRPSTAASRR